MPKKQTEWSRAYNEKTYDRLAITIPKGRKADVETLASKAGESVNGLINSLLRDAMGKTEEEWKSKPVRDE
ncbi:MAG: antitoxin [Clostridia bacterium]|nr:antitoxin [Clostridia bacterium]